MTQLNKKPTKAVGLISGGLDSTLAAKIIRDMGIEVYGIYFAMPWGCCDKTQAFEAAQKLGIHFITLQLDERYLEVVKNPRFGYGSALNPCVDCRIHMFTRAALYMKEIQADFVFSGEVLGQRQMSQLRHNMKWIEEGSGLQGRLLRPLCAHFMEPTIPELEGHVDRSKLLKITGRSRKEQMTLAKQFEITNYPQPAGGCSLTHPDFAKKMKDTFKYGYRNFRETIALKWGRHFRINEHFKAILGRDEEENESLIRYAHPDDYIMQMPQKNGPTLILKGTNPPEEILTLAAGFIQKYSKDKNSPSITVDCWMNKNKNAVSQIQSKLPTEEQLEAMYIS